MEFLPAVTSNTLKLNDIVLIAKDRRASDVHLEAGLPATFRINSNLLMDGKPTSNEDLSSMAQDLVGEAKWPVFVERGSMDLAQTIEGIRCRINILQTERGIGMAIRLLSSFVPTVETLNLHPDFKQLASISNGLILVSGPTGSGKSSTLAALIQEINQSLARHIITLEYPIEFQFTPLLSLIRQRELGRHTASMEQALIDAMREDPDVLMVGEMREPKTMRLTLNASETGHLVFATIHSATCVEALQRMISAFPSDIQTSVAAQLADCLSAVVCQRLTFHEDLGILLPECEVLRPTPAVKNFIRRGEIQHIASAIETGAEDGMWTFDRYRAWMKSRDDWSVPSRGDQN
jgi:twitching motility protein PilT